MRKSPVPVLLFIFFSFSLFAQPALTERNTSAKENNFFDRVFFGGSFGLQFGTQTTIEIAPSVGYKITDRFSSGINLKYLYYRYKDDFNRYSTQIYGGGPFARFFVIENLFLHSEFEVLNLDVPNATYTKYVRQNITSVFLGGGYRQMIGNRSSLDILLLYNVNESRNTPYQNPVIRIGFGFGI